MSTTYSVPPPVNGSRGRHGHKRSSHRTSTLTQPAISSVDFAELRNNSQTDFNAPARSNGYAPVSNHNHQHSYSASHTSHRGDDVSDLGARNPQTCSNNLWEVLTGVLISAPYVLTSVLLSSRPSMSEPNLQPDEDLEGIDHVLPEAFPHGASSGSGFLKASVLTSACLLLIGLFEKLRVGDSVESAHGNKTSRHRPGIDHGLVRASFTCAIAIWLPVFASLSLGGERVALTMLVVFASGLPPLFDTRTQTFPVTGGMKLLKSWGMTLCFLIAMVVFDLVSVGFLQGGSSPTGYLALTLSVFFARPPFRNLSQSAQEGISPEAASIPCRFSRTGDGVAFASKASGPSTPASADETTVTLLSGAALSIFTFLVTALFGEVSIDIFSSLIVGMVACVSSASFILSSPEVLNSSAKVGLASGSAFSILSTSVALQRWSWALVVEICLGSLGYFAAYVDASRLYTTPHSQRHSHNADGDRNASRITLYLLRSCEQFPLLHSILREKDSRRIFYFMSLNFVFMLIQLSYGFATGSLGLLSDSIHMFFDCLALVVGLCAAVMSKWPPSARFPYGYGKVDTLAGFANGVFLMIISIEIVYEAVERLLAGSQMHRIGELLVVSAAGLCVNLVGIMAFDHAHHGHGHGHSHGHDHGSGREGEHSHSHSHHTNENMHGIFLHILADTLGSVAVVISTILVHFYEWPGFDPLASCIIAVLIFVSAIPLVNSTANMLLLSLPADVEYSLRDTLAGVSSLRGVVGYTVPKFWLDDIAATTPDVHGHSGHDHGDHHHHHHHHHDHSHGHSHDHHRHDGDTKSHDKQRILGVIHVIASQGADLEDVRQRTIHFLQEKNMDIVVQVERESDGRCWCGSGNRAS